MAQSTGPAAQCLLVAVGNRLTGNLPCCQGPRRRANLLLILRLSLLPGTAPRPSPFLADGGKGQRRGGCRADEIKAGDHGDDGHPDRRPFSSFDGHQRPFVSNPVAAKHGSELDSSWQRFIPRPRLQQLTCRCSGADDSTRWPSTSELGSRLARERHRHKIVHYLSTPFPAGRWRY